ncbi:MAG: transporter, partial [Rhodoferax sp.]|nr:transporter [Rhodoferax sp.]
WLGVDSLRLVVGLLLVGFGLNGVIVPLSFVTAMEGHPTQAGSASALIGTMTFTGAAVVVAAVSPFTNGSPLPMALGIAACSVAGFLLSRRTLKVRRAAPPVHRPAQALR